MSFFLLVLRLGPSTADADELRARDHAPRITVSPETTHVVEPKTADGFVDLAAAIDERFGRGLLPEDNAAVLLLDALGPAPNGDRLPDEFYESLGMPVPPDDGDFFFDLPTYLASRAGYDPSDARHTEVLEQRLIARSDPWKPARFPHLAGWLTANASPLNRIAEAVRRPRYFTPVGPIAPPGRARGLSAVHLSGAIALREVTHALLSRAMLHLGQGDQAEAWGDIVTIYRLGRLIGQGSTMIEGLLGYHVDGLATAAALNLIKHANPGAEAARGYLRGLERLPEIPPIAERIDFTERLAFVDAVLLVAEGGARNEKLMREFDERLIPLSRRIHNERFPQIHWDAALRIGMRWHDRLASAMRESTPRDRFQARKRLEQDLTLLEDQFRNHRRFERAVQPTAHPDTAGEAVGELMTVMLCPR